MAKREVPQGEAVPRKFAVTQYMVAVEEHLLEDSRHCVEFVSLTKPKSARTRVRIEFEGFDPPIQVGRAYKVLIEEDEWRPIGLAQMY